MGFQNLVSFLGVFILLGVAYLLSTNRKAVDKRVVIWGMGLQFIFALIVFKFEPGKRFFLFLNGVVVKLLDFTVVGAKFVFGEDLFHHYFAMNVLPTIIFFSSLMAILYHLGVMQKLVLIFAKIMCRFMGTSGAESLSASANIFVGQTEAPLVIRPYVDKMTQSELMAVMTGGMATVAGGVMGAYVGMLVTRFPNIAGHLISASILSAPAALVLAKIMVPETEEPMTRGEVKLELEQKDANVIDAAANGAADGLQLALNVGGMLIAFVALIAMINFGVGKIGEAVNWAGGVDPYQVTLKAFPAERMAAVKPGMEIGLDIPGELPFKAAIKEINGQTIIMDRRIPENFKDASFHIFDKGKRIDGSSGAEGTTLAELSLERILGTLFWPFAWIMGVPAVDCHIIGRLLGEKLILTEFVAYLNLSHLLTLGAIKDPRSVVIATYALCGFANFASIAIQIGGIGGIAPSRRGDLARLGIRSVIAGTLAAFMTANIAGIFFTGETVLLNPNDLKTSSVVRPAEEMFQNNDDETIEDKALAILIQK